MNKKLGSFLLAASLFISGCRYSPQKNPGATDIEVEEVGGEYVAEVVGEISENEEGQRTIVKTLANLNESQTKGPFKITIRNVSLSQFKPKSEKVFEYGGDDLGLISIYLEVENTTAETALIYPNQGMIQTDTGKKMATHFSLSDSVGGKYQGRSAKARAKCIVLLWGKQRMFQK